MAQIQQRFGPHTLDLMSLESNVMRNVKGHPLPHFTPFPLPGSSGVNMFAQSLDVAGNCYVFPPFCLVGPTLRFLL